MRYYARHIVYCLCCVISQRNQVLADINSLTSPCFTEMPAPSQETEQTYIDILGVSIVRLPTIFLMDFRTVPTMWYFLFFDFILDIVVLIRWTS